MSKILKDFPQNKFYYIIIAFAVLLGILVRFKGLGTWPLALDEYYVIKSSENILKYGLPQFQNGGYYSRGIFLQYLIAGFIYLGVKAEFAGRFFSVISNLLTLPPIFFISKRIGNIKIATAVIVIFCFSIWEIEFARFARMYSPFQAIFMWYTYFALIDYQENNFRNFNKLLLLSFLSIFIYEGSIFLAVFNFVPFIVFKKIKIRYLLGSFIVLIISFFSNTFSFRKFESSPTLPPEFANEISTGVSNFPIKIPPALIQFTGENFISITGVVILAIITGYYFYKIYKLSFVNDIWNILSLIFLWIILILNQFGLFILIFTVLKFWNLLNIDLKNKKVLLFIFSAFVINLIFWYGFGLIFKNWYPLFDDFSSFTIWGISKRLFVGFFNFPDNYYSFFNYLKTLPFLTVFSALFMIFLIFKLFFIESNKQKTKNINFLIASLIFVVLLSTLPPLLYEETRYTFFAVPLLMILVAISVYDLSSLIFIQNRSYKLFLFFGILSISFFISKDFNIYHLITIDNEKTNYRMIYDSNDFKKHLYRRWDIKSTTNFVKKHLQKNDLIMINENSMEYYLPKVDYFNFNYKHHAFSSISVENGTKERWSSAKMIYTNEDLISIIENRETTVWFLVYPEFWFHDIDFYNRYQNNLVYKGIDGMIKVYKFPL